ncbi:hypothetical protein Ahy_A03g016929 [Arachis hypogaea]|uniref:DNA helicase Pif1-like 2B domain-containing protein n=1 Tax=Arachis hypogaea TaxID=3818 RepID=A0A445E4Y3_ARAHY|nr:hypothetical protein Ahy_A03g016929 [Arachis hypogaea]
MAEACSLYRLNGVAHVAGSINEEHEIRLRIIWVLQFPFGRTLTYSQFSNKFVWKEDISLWMPRKQDFSISRLTHVPRESGKDYYLRLLRNIQKGCQCYDVLSKDILYFQEKSMQSVDLQLSEDQIMNLTLSKIKKKLQANGRSLREFDGMPFPSFGTIEGLDDWLIIDELNFDVDVLRNQLFDQLVDFVYLNLLVNINNTSFFKDRSILGPTLEVVNDVNSFIMQRVDADVKIYLSSDTLCLEEGNMESELDILTPDVLNIINCSGLPPHELALKVGVPIMLLRNIDQSKGYVTEQDYR